MKGTMSHLVPPGIEIRSNYEVIHEGATDDSWQWLPYTKVKYYTNAFIVRNEKILLGYKKRGFGQGLFNGFGGKVEAEETSVQAATRELQEEAGIDAPLTHRGTLFFVLDEVEAAFHIELYAAEDYTGTITETDEMRPQWFSTSNNAYDTEFPAIPYEKMWADDIYWMPMLLANRPFVGRADFTNGNKMQRWWFAETKRVQPN